jgi:hypothetical protein
MVLNGLAAIALFALEHLKCAPRTELKRILTAESSKWLLTAVGGRYGKYNCT